MGWDGSPLFERRLPKCLMHYNEKRHLCSHKAFSVSPSEAKYLRPLSASDPFSHTPPHLIPALLPQTSSTILFAPSIPPPVTVRVPCFPLGRPIGCVNVPRQLCNIISWVVASRSLLLHNLPATVCQSTRVPFSSAFLRHKHDPLMTMAVTPPIPDTGEIVPPCSRMTPYITAEAKRNKVGFLWIYRKSLSLWTTPPTPHLMKKATGVSRCLCTQYIFIASSSKTATMLLASN